MTPEKAVEKALEEMIEQRVVLPGHKNIVKRYLYMLYTIGYDSGTRSRSNQKPVLQFDKFGNFIREYESAAQASRATKIDHSSIVNVCKEKQHTAGKFIWKYKNKTS